VTIRPASVDALLAAAGLEPGAGVQVVDAARLASVPFDPGLPLVVLRAPVPEAAPGVLPGRHAHDGGAALLGRLYPPGHRVRRLAADGVGGADGDGAGADAGSGEAERTVDQLSDEELAASDWLVPPLSSVDNIASPHGMAAISARLRASDGCPWDRKQTHATLRPFVLEEAYETVDAIERGTAADLAEELGDLFLQIILHAQLAAEEGTFDLVDVYRTLGAKIVRRHPLVFGDF
jgi:tetrapyrrole methylase family protein/MazG family protein